MNIEIVAIGDEVLSGFVLNRNASFIAQRLIQHGFMPLRHHTVGDNPEQVKKQLLDCFSRGSSVIATGGLGPTIDDCTRAIVADLFQVPMVKDEKIYKDLQRRYGPNFSTLDDQATVLKNAEVYPNPVGTAPGFVIEDHKRFGPIFLMVLPGVPSEMEAIFLDHGLQFLEKKKMAMDLLPSKIYHIFGLWESLVDPTLREMQTQFPGLRFGIYPGFATLSVHIKSIEKQGSFNEATAYFEERFKNNIYDAESGEITEAVHKLLLKGNKSVAVAESCTGGELAATFVTYPGASTYFQGGIIAYANQVKEDELGITPEIIREKGVVSEAVAEAMAKAVAKKLSTNIGIGVSGILGPTGGTPEKPVGTVSASIIIDGKAKTWTMNLRGDRVAIRRKAINFVMIELYRMVAGK